MWSLQPCIAGKTMLNMNINCGERGFAPGQHCEINSLPVHLRCKVAAVSIMDNNLFKWRLQLKNFDEGTPG